MHHFKTLALSTVLLFTATVETQAAKCYPCPTGTFTFTCGHGTCNKLSLSNGTGTWSVISPQWDFKGTAKLSTALAPKFGPGVSCTYIGTYDHPTITLTSTTCTLVGCPANQFSCP